MDSQHDLDQASIKDLHLSRRTYNALHRSGVYSVGELKELFQNGRLERVHFIGQKSIDEVSNALIEFYKDESIPILKVKNSERTFHSSNEIASSCRETEFRLMLYPNSESAVGG